MDISYKSHIYHIYAFLCWAKAQPTRTYYRFKETAPNLFSQIDY